MIEVHSDVVDLCTLWLDVSGELATCWLRTIVGDGGVDGKRMSGLSERVNQQKARGK